MTSGCGAAKFAYIEDDGLIRDGETAFGRWM
jgi:hypothetical protein